MTHRARGQALLEFAVVVAVIAVVAVPVAAVVAAPAVSLFARADSALQRATGEITMAATPTPAPSEALTTAVSGATPLPASSAAPNASPFGGIGDPITATPSPTGTPGPSPTLADGTPAPTSGPAATASPTATPETLAVAWTFGPSCDGWTNATWTGTGCAAAASPQVMTSPIVPLVGSGTHLRVVAFGGTTNPQNLEMKLRDYAGNTSTISLAPLASGDGTIDATIIIAPGTVAFGLSAQGPGEIDAASISLAP